MSSIYDRKSRGPRRKERPESEDESATSAEQESTASNIAASGLATLAADSAISARVGKFLDTFEDRVHVEQPVEDTSGSAASSGSPGSAGSSDRDSARDAVFNDRGEMASRPVIVEPYEQQEEEVDDIHVQAARDYLKSTGRYEDVDSMSHAEINAALKVEGYRAELGIEHNVQMSAEQLQKLAGIMEQDAIGEQWDAVRNELVQSGAFTQEEVDAMSQSELTAASIVIRDIEPWEGPASSVRVIDEDTSSVISGGSIGLVNTQTGTGTSEDSTGSTSDESNSSGTTPSNDQSSNNNDDGSDDDDDDDDKDGNENQDQTEETTATAESEGSESKEGSGQGTSSTTPTPDAPVTVDPATLAAFAASPLGRESNALASRAIEMGAGGGLVAPADNDAGREAFLATPLAAEHLSTLARGVEVAKSGGHTDPTEGETARGVVPLDELKLIGGGVIDFVDDPSPPPPEDNPLFPVNPGDLGPQLESAIDTNLVAQNLGHLSGSLRADIESVADQLEDIDG